MGCLCASVSPRSVAVIGAASNASRDQGQADRGRDGDRWGCDRRAVGAARGAACRGGAPREPRARAAACQRDLPPRARGGDGQQGSLYQALRTDPGLRAILESSIYGESVTDASILDTMGTIVASSDPTQVGLRAADTRRSGGAGQRGGPARPAAVSSIRRRGSRSKCACRCASERRRSVRFVSASPRC